MNRSYTIKPDDIRTQEFRGKLRGYDPVQVRSFLEEVADQVQGLQFEVRDLRKRLAAAEQDASQRARVVPETTDASWKPPSSPDVEAEAAAILDRARAQARNYEAEAMAQMSDLALQIDELKAMRARLITQIETLLNSQLEHLDRIKGNLNGDEAPAPEAPPVLASYLDDTTV